MLAGHSALGLAFAWLIYVVCLSATVAVFANEFKRWEQPDGPTVRGSSAPTPSQPRLQAVFDGTGKSLGDGGFETGAIGQQMLGAISPLHVGWFGGLTVKVIYGLLGL